MRTLITFSPARPPIMFVIITFPSNYRSDLIVGGLSDSYANIAQALEFIVEARRNEKRDCVQICAIFVMFHCISNTLMLTITTITYRYIQILRKLQQHHLLDQQRNEIDRLRLQYLSLIPRNSLLYLFIL